MTSYKCLIVDDEPLARLVVKNYINRIGCLELIKEFKNGIEATDFLILNSDIDIIFLDINMPNLSGIDFFKNLINPPKVIFTTAYEEYAVESYDLNAIDYLLKPFSYERFIIAINKVKEQIDAEAMRKLILEETEKSIIIKSEGKSFVIKPNDILYCEAMKNYTKIYLKSGERLLTLVSISKIESNLKDLSEYFVKVHRSFIVNKKHITAINSNELLIDKNVIPIGYNYKNDLLLEIQNRINV